MNLQMDNDNAKFWIPFSNKVNALLFFLLIIKGCYQVSGQQASCHLRELDLCAASLLVFTQGPSG